MLKLFDLINVKPEYQSYLNLFLKNLIFPKSIYVLKYSINEKNHHNVFKAKTDEIKLTYINIHVY